MSTAAAIKRDSDLNYLVRNKKWMLIRHCMTPKDQEHFRSRMEEVAEQARDKSTYLWSVKEYLQDPYTLQFNIIRKILLEHNIDNSAEAHALHRRYKELLKGEEHLF